MRYGLVNAHMFGTQSEPGEHVFWDRPDYFDEGEFAEYGIAPDAASYAADNPHMIVFEEES